MPLPIVRPLLLSLSLTALFAAPAPAGEVRTLTAKDGRTIEAEILGYKDDVVRIRRTDTGKEHRLPIGSLSAAEQESLRTFLEAHPELRETIRADALRVEFSRRRDTSPKIQGSGETTTLSQISFSITVTNRSNETLKKLRADYVIFVEEDPDRRPRKTDEPLNWVEGSQAIEVLEPSRSENFVTKTVLWTETRRARSWTENVGGQLIRYTRAAEDAGTFHDRDIKGVGIRIYDGDKLVHQMVSPETLASEYTRASSPDSEIETVQ